MRRVLIVGATLVGICAGCGGSHAKQLSLDELPRAVLQQSDLPSWTQFQSDSGTGADAGSLGSSDRLGAWIARYRKSSGGVVVSRVDLYRDAKAARTVFASFRGTVDGSTVKTLPSPALGDEHAGYTTGTLESVFWRRGNAVVSIVLEGNGITAHDASRLATLEDARISALLG